MSLISRDHEASIIIFVGLVYVSSVSDEVLDNVQSAIETGGSEWGAEGLGGVVHVGPSTDQALDDAEVAGTCSAPQCCGP